MALLRRVAGGLAHSLRLSSQQFQQAAAIHLSASLDARRRQAEEAGSESESEDEQAGPSGQRSNPEDEQRLERMREGLRRPEFDPADVQNAGFSDPARVMELVRDPSSTQWDVAFTLSPMLADALEAAPEDPAGADRVLEELAEMAERIDKGEELKGDEQASAEDLLALAEAIDLYFVTVPAEEPDPAVLKEAERVLDEEEAGGGRPRRRQQQLSAAAGAAAAGQGSLEGAGGKQGEAEEEENDDWGEDDRAALWIVGETIKERFGDGAAKAQVLNIAPPGQLPYEVLDIDEEMPLVNWGVDLTEGKAQDPWRNALLSQEAKSAMWDLHANHGWSARQVAEHFGIREQRAMAILALQERERKAEQEGQPLYTELQEAMDELQGADAVVGARERHHVVLPSYPNYRELSEEDADVLAALLEKRLGKRFEEVEADDITPELRRELLAAAGMDKEAVEAELAAREEEHLVAEFRQNLEYNLGKIGKSLSRAPRSTHPPARPEEGWSLLVTPVGKKAGERRPYVAKPDGSQRELTADEKLAVDRAKPRPRYKVM